MTNLRRLLFPACIAITCLAMPLTMLANGDDEALTQQDYVNALYEQLSYVTAATTAIPLTSTISDTTTIATIAQGIATAIATIVGFELTPEDPNPGQPPTLGSAIEKVYDLFFVAESSAEVTANDDSVATVPFLPITMLTPASGAAILKANCAALRKALTVEPITVILDALEEGEDPIIHGPFTVLHSVVHQGSSMQSSMAQPMRHLRAAKLGQNQPPQGPSPVQQHFMRPEAFDPMEEAQALKLKAFFAVADSTAPADATAALSAKDGFENTVLHYATVFTNSKNINTLIIDPLFKKMTTAQKLTLLAVQNLWGNTPLHYAAGASNPFSRGDAGLSRPSKEGLTYRFTKDIIADAKGDRAAASATISAKNLAGLTPLHAATSTKESIGNLNQLLSLLPVPTAKDTTDNVLSTLSKAIDFFGNTPLHYFLLRAFSAADESNIQQAHNRPPDDNFSHGFAPPGSGFNMDAWNNDEKFLEKLTTGQQTAYNAIETDDAKETYLSAIRTTLRTKFESRGELAAALAVFLGNIKTPETILKQANTFGLTPLALLKCGNPNVDLLDNTPPDELEKELLIAQALQEVSLAYLPVHFRPFIGVERVGEGQPGPGGNPGGGGGGGEQSPATMALIELINTVVIKASNAAAGNFKEALLELGTALQDLIPVPEGLNMDKVNGLVTRATELKNQFLAQQFNLGEANNALVNLQTAATTLKDSISNGNDAFKEALTELIGIAPLPSP